MKTPTPTPTPLTDEQIEYELDSAGVWEQGRWTTDVPVGLVQSVEAARDAQWVEMLEKQEPVAWMFTAPGITKVDVWKHGGNWKPLYTHPQPDDTELLKQALEALRLSAPCHNTGGTLRKAMDEAITALEARLNPKETT